MCSEPYIHTENLCFTYRDETENREYPALKGVSVDIQKGEYVALLGHNGSGKSTFAKLLNLILEPTSGKLVIDGVELTNREIGEEELLKLRKKVGMVFQNPDNQFVSSILAEDIAFGLENYGLPREEIDQKVKSALALTGMSSFEDRAPHTLSGGQRQRAALAGVLAVEPEILVFDESTAMLDPEGRGSILSVIKELHDAGRTIIMITHYVEETVMADRILLMKGGKIIGEGTPREILTDRGLMEKAAILPPMPVRLYYELLDEGIELPFCPLDDEELTELLCQSRSVT